MKKLITLIMLTVFVCSFGIAYADANLPVALISGVVKNVDNDPDTVVPFVDVDVVCQTAPYAGNTYPTKTDWVGYYTTDTTYNCPMGGTVLVNVKDDDGNIIGSSTGTVDFQGVGTIYSAQVDVGVSNVNVGIPEFPITAIPAVLSMLSFGLIRKRLI